MVKTKLEKLNLLDRFLFDEAMEDRETYQAVVSILLENEVEILEKPQTEKEFRISPELRQVRLDVVAMDAQKKIYYTEMQKRDTKNLIRRSRYYQALLDSSLLETGSKDFNLLNDSCFILVAPFDLFGRGLYRYTFEEVCRECPDLRLDDGAVRVFINTKGTNREAFSQEFLDFMEYISNTTDEKAEHTESKKIRRIHEKICQIRKSEKAGVKYMQRWEELAYAKEDGKEEGVRYLLIRQVCKKLAKQKTPEKIAEELEEDIAEILSICKAAEEFAPEYDSDKVFGKIFPIREMDWI